MVVLSCRQGRGGGRFACLTRVTIYYIEHSFPVDRSFLSQELLLLAVAGGSLSFVLPHVAHKVFLVLRVSTLAGAAGERLGGGAHS